jgi:mutator protein MutT
MAVDIRVVSKAIVVNPKGQVLLLRRSAGDERRPNEWDIPGGHVEADEYPAEAAARETMEEAGLSVNSLDLVLVYAMTEQVTEDMSVTWMFHLVSTTETDVTVSEEHSEYQWMPLDAALQTITYQRQLRALSFVAENNLLSSL